MDISYNKLWELLIDKDIKKNRTLQCHLTKFRHNDKDGKKRIYQNKNSCAYL